MESQKNTKLNSKVIISVIIILLLLIVIALCVMLFLKPDDAADTEPSGNRLAYEANVITDDAATLQDAVNRLLEKAKEGQMALEMQTSAFSSDGKNFQCYLANAKENNYDMFMVFYLDATQEEIYRTGLIPVGSRIEEFTLDKALESGNHTITIVFNQVEDDQETIHGQVNVGLELVVK